jgi:hypothetical protein
VIVDKVLSPFGRNSNPIKDSIIELFPLEGGPTKITFGRDRE